mgnify:CR=1 FL=1
MTSETILTHGSLRGIHLQATGPTIRVCPAAAPTPGLRSLLVEVKAEVVALLQAQEGLPQPPGRAIPSRCHGRSSRSHAGFLEQIGPPRRDPERAGLVIDEARRWRLSRAAWLRRILEGRP